WWLSEKDLDKARRLLPECYFEELFRLGYSLIAQLQQRVRSLKSSSITPWLAHSDRDCIAALNQPSPAYFAGLDDPLHGGTRLFKNLDDLARVAERVTAICAEQQLFEDVFAFELPSPEDLDLSDCQPDDTDDLTLSDFFLTALANKLLGGEFEATPVAAEKLMTLHGMVAEESKVNSALRKEVTGWLGPLAPGGAAFAEQCMQRWDEEFCAVAAQDLDARFVRGIIVRM
ncbi:MAG: DUF6178 family protein, partial [Desulfuromonadales bacterium]|nr:DUF6178 family protein [Desulfuromonadales bacterium]